jgi:hypothetical protein
MTGPYPFEVFAIRYARHDDWPLPVQFQDRANGAETMVMDFFSWVAVGEDTTVVIDTGFDAEEAALV